MDMMSKFKLSAADIKQLEPYLQHDPDNICSGIPDVVAEQCSEILDLMCEVETLIAHGQLETLWSITTRKVFEKALEMIFNRPFIVDESNILAAGAATLKEAQLDLTERAMEGISDEARLEIPDWDNGMIACAVIKACGNAAKSALVPA